MKDEKLCGCGHEMSEHRLGPPSPNMKKLPPGFRWEFYRCHCGCLHLDLVKDDPVPEPFQGGKL